MVAMILSGRGLSVVALPLPLLPLPDDPPLGLLLLLLLLLLMLLLLLLLLFPFPDKEESDNDPDENDPVENELVDPLGLLFPNELEDKEPLGLLPKEEDDPPANDPEVREDSSSDDFCPEGPAFIKGSPSSGL